MSMTESEAKSRLSYLKSKAENALSNTSSNCEWAKKDVEGTIVALAMAISALEELEQYRAIGTVSEFRELKEKATAKKLKHGVCPNCSTNNDMIIKNLGNPQGHKTIFCWNCGSAIDWSEGKE